MNSLQRHEGYYEIDHRLSPGTAMVPEGKRLECGIVICCHCHRGVLLNPERKRPRNHCKRCDRYTCDTSACLVGCNSIEELFTKLQEEAALELNVKEI